ncbi:hypothetical protein Ancab_036698, partial [Ancistrocladus abbreviatus]
FLDIQNQSEMEKQMAGIWIGSYKLRVNAARLKGPKDNSVPKKQRELLQSEMSSAKRRLGVSFAKV